MCIRDRSHTAAVHLRCEIERIHVAIEVRISEGDVYKRQVECGRQQVVGLRYPVALTGDDLAVAVHIVVITIDLNQAGVGLDTIDIVIQLSLIHI